MKHLRTLFNLALASCFLAAMVSISSCTLTQERLVTKGLLTAEPCGPPCWQGLVPGVSTEEEVREFLGSSDYVGPYTEYPGRFEGVTVVRWQRTWETRRWNEFDMRHGLLVLMGMYVDSGVTLERVVDRYGPPDKFEAGLKMSGQIYTLVSLFYHELGMMVDLHLSGDHPELKPHTTVVRVWYFEPSPLEEAIATVEGKKGEPLEDFEREWLDYWHDWEGYGPVEPEYGYP